MLDEPTAGVPPIVVEELLGRIVEVRARGLAVLMVEQSARQALEIADRGYVLVEGRNAVTDTGAALLAQAAQMRLVVMDVVLLLTPRFAPRGLLPERPPICPKRDASDVAGPSTPTDPSCSPNGNLVL